MLASPNGSIRRPAPALLAVAGATLLTLAALGGCQKPDKPLTWGVRSLEAPHHYSIAPENPHVFETTEFASVSMSSRPQPVLPPMPLRGADSLYSGVQPLDVSIGRDSMPAHRPFGVPGLHSGGGLPIEQLIFGGPYPERGADGVYRYHPRDQLRITVKDHPEFDGLVTIEPDGTLRIPNTQDHVRAAGLEQAQVAAHIAKTIRPYVQRPPVVRIATVLGQGGHYHIFGGVTNPGRYPIGDQPLRLSEAVFRALSTRLQASESDSVTERLAADLSGGPREHFRHLSDLREVDLITPHRSHPHRESVNVAESLFGGRTESDPYIRPGQIILVRTGAERPLLEAVDGLFRQ